MECIMRPNQIRSQTFGSMLKKISAVHLHLYNRFESAGLSFLSKYFQFDEYID